MNNSCAINRPLFLSRKSICGSWHIPFAGSFRNYLNDYRLSDAHQAGIDDSVRSHRSHIYTSDTSYICNFVFVYKSFLSFLASPPIFLSLFFVPRHIYSSISNIDILSRFYSASSSLILPFRSERRYQLQWNHLYSIACGPFSSFSLPLLYAKVALVTSVISYRLLK